MSNIVGVKSVKTSLLYYSSARNIFTCCLSFDIISSEVQFLPLLPELTPRTSFMGTKQPPSTPWSPNQWRLSHHSDRHDRCGNERLLCVSRSEQHSGPAENSVHHGLGRPYGPWPWLSMGLGWAGTIRNQWALNWSGLYFCALFRSKNKSHLIKCYH